jgi:hypothetical protein
MMVDSGNPMDPRSLVFTSLQSAKVSGLGLQVATCSWIYDVSFAPEFILSQLCKFLAH